MNNEPLVTVNILSYNRKNELHNTLTKVFEQDYKNIEVIVVDNASSDGSAEMVEKEFPGIILIKMEKNIGIAGWNEGFEIANGKYVLVLDDDSYPELNTILSGINEMLKDEKIGIVAFNIFNTKLNKSETQSFNLEHPTFFIGCGAMIKKRILDEIGYFDELYFIYYNEVDLSIRVWDRNYKLKYLSNSFVYHDISSKRAISKRASYLVSAFSYLHVTIGYQIFLLKYFNVGVIIKYSIKWFLNRTIIAIRFGYFGPMITSYYQILKKIPTIIKKRKVVSNNVQSLYNYAKIPLIERDYFPNFIKPGIFFTRNNQ